MYLMKRLMIVVLATVPLLLGCDSSPAVQESEGTVPTAGTVTLDGQPLAKGEITFIDPEAQRPMSFVAEVRNGQFELRAPSGVMRVEIRAFELVGGDDDTPLSEELIPARYNDQSELSVELMADGPNMLSFELESARG